MSFPELTGCSWERGGWGIKHNLLYHSVISKWLALSQVSMFKALILLVHICYPAELSMSQILSITCFFHHQALHSLSHILGTATK